MATAQGVRHQDLVFLGIVSRKDHEMSLGIPADVVVMDAKLPGAPIQVSRAQPGQDRAAGIQVPEKDSRRQVSCIQSPFLAQLLSNLLPQEADRVWMERVERTMARVLGSSGPAPDRAMTIDGKR